MARSPCGVTPVPLLAEQSGQARGARQQLLSFFQRIRMISYLFFLNLFLLIHGDCLEFSHNQSTNACLIISNDDHGRTSDRQYPECLRCTIGSFVPPESLQLEENSPCSRISLQCIQIIFSNQTIFEAFFDVHQPMLYDLFFKDNGTDQNTLHVTLEENTLNEINGDFVQRTFHADQQAYRALLFELQHQDRPIAIHRDLTNVTRLSMEIILSCGEKRRVRETIYIVHNRRITVETGEGACPATLIPSMSTSSSPPSSTIVLLESQPEPTRALLVIGLLTTVLLSTLTVLSIGAVKYVARYFSRPRETIARRSTQHDVSPATPLSIETPTVSVPVKAPRALRGMRAVQLLDDDV